MMLAKIKVLCFFGFLVALAVPVSAETYSLLNGTGDYGAQTWSISGGRTTTTPPGLNDDVTLDNCTLTIQPDLYELKSLVLSGSTLNAQGDLALSVTESITVNRTSSLAGATFIFNINCITLAINNNARLDYSPGSSALTIRDVTIGDSGVLAITGTDSLAAVINGNMSLDQNALFEETFPVTSSINVNGNLVLGASARFSSTTTAGATCGVTIRGNITLGQSATFETDFDAASSVNFNGNVTLGNLSNLATTGVSALALSPTGSSMTWSNSGTFSPWNAGTNITSVSLSGSNKTFHIAGNTSWAIFSSTGTTNQLLFDGNNTQTFSNTLTVSSPITVDSSGTNRTRLECTRNITLLGAITNPDNLDIVLGGTAAQTVTKTGTVGSLSLGANVIATLAGNAAFSRGIALGTSAQLTIDPALAAMDVGGDVDLGTSAHMTTTRTTGSFAATIGGTITLGQSSVYTASFPASSTMSVSGSLVLNNAAQFTATTTAGTFGLSIAGALTLNQNATLTTTCFDASTMTLGGNVTLLATSTLATTGVSSLVLSPTASSLTWSNQGTFTPWNAGTNRTAVTVSGSTKNVHIAGATTWLDFASTVSTNQVFFEGNNTQTFNGTLDVSSPITFDATGTNRTTLVCTEDVTLSGTYTNPERCDLVLDGTVSQRVSKSASIGSIALRNRAADNTAVVTLASSASSLGDITVGEYARLALDAALLSMSTGGDLAIAHNGNVSITNTGSFIFNIGGDIALGEDAAFSMSCGNNTRITVLGNVNLGARSRFNLATSAGMATISFVGNLDLGQDSTFVTSFVSATSISVSKDVVLGASAQLTTNGITQFTIAGNWLNSTGTFTPWNNSATEYTTVTFANGSLTPPVTHRVTGANTWPGFECTSAGSIFKFEKNKTQTISRSLHLVGTDSSPIVLTRDDTDQSTLVPTGSGAIPDAAAMWQINMAAADNLEACSNLEIKYSDARATPLPVPAESRTLAGTTYKWMPGCYALYSYTEDSDLNGKIDRIRITTEKFLNGNFAGMAASVIDQASNVPYAINSALGTGGFAQKPASDYDTAPLKSTNLGKEFYIYLKEKGENDSDARLVIQFTNWGQLKCGNTAADAGQFSIALPDGAATMTTTDTAPPIIAHTLALPESNEVFVHFSSVVQAVGTSYLAAFNNGVAPARYSNVRVVGAAGAVTASDFVVSLASHTITVAEILASNPMDASSQFIQLGSSALADNATAPALDYSVVAAYQNLGRRTALAAPYNNAWPGTGPAWPNLVGFATRSLPATHRISDVIISRSKLGAVDASAFAAPLAVFSGVVPNPGDAQIVAGTGVVPQSIGLIRTFDGSQKTFEGALRLVARFGFDASWPAFTGAAIEFAGKVDTRFINGPEKNNSGLWLPDFSESDFSGLVPYPFSGSFGGAGATQIVNTAFTASGTDRLYGFNIGQDAITGLDSDRIDFFLSIKGASNAEKLYCVRFDVPDAGTPPADWYAHLASFSFGLLGRQQQKAQVTILNNVIDPTKDEKTYLEYSLTSSTLVNINVFTLDGDLVRRLVRSSQDAGSYRISWDGKNTNGYPLAKGIYIIRFVAKGVDEIRKVMVVKR